MITMILLVTGIIGLCWALNQLFLEEYYIHEKKETLFTTFGTIEEAYEEEIIGEDEFDITFEKLCSQENLNILIVDADSHVIRSSTNEIQSLLEQMQEVMLGKELDIWGRLPAGTGMDLILETNRYILLHQTDSRLEAEYLVLYGELGDGCYVYMRTALQSIRESAQITNRFFLAVGLFGLLVSIIVIFFIVRSVVRPVKEMTDVSRAMSELHFEVKYEPKKQDGAELVELGEHMNYLSDTLEKTISDLKSANNELMQDIEKKERIDEMRREFISNVSHELKTPIALIQGYAEGLKEGVGDDAQSRDYYCEVIADEAGKMNRMVKQLLTLNHLEFGNETVDMKRFNISEMIEGLVQSNQLLAAQSGITIEFEETEPAYVWADAFKVEDALGNYISNAMHFADGERRIRIYYERREAMLRICVFNTGQQIPEEELEKIWTKFYKVDKARTREYGGSGVGLSIVKACMEAMNCGCGVRNLSNGVEFWIELENGCITD